MEPIATYDELVKMDDATFLKAVKARQLAEAQAVEQAKANETVKVSAYEELKAFDEETQKQMSALEVSRSLARTEIEKKWALILKPSATFIPVDVTKGM